MCPLPGALPRVLVSAIQKVPPAVSVVIVIAIIVGCCNKPMKVATWSAAMSTNAVGVPSTVSRGAVL